MLQFLTELEGSAVQLDNMKRGAQISTVAGSSVGAVGGVLSIVGLALAPVTAGVSLALTMAGVGMGVTSGVYSVGTTVTEMGVNRTQKIKANKFFQSFMKEMQTIQGCLEDVATKMLPVVSKEDVTVGAGKILGKGGAIGKGIDSLIDCASGVKLLRSENAIADLGQAAKGTPLALSKAARGGFIALNALFIGLDVFLICKDSVGLAKGSKSEVSQLIRARARLWSSELESWQKIHDSLKRGLLTSKDTQNLLEMPFYPLEEMTKGKKTFPLPLFLLLLQLFLFLLLPLFPFQLLLFLLLPLFLLLLLLLPFQLCLLLWLSLHLPLLCLHCLLPIVQDFYLTFYLFIGLY